MARNLHFPEHSQLNMWHIVQYITNDVLWGTRGVCIIKQNENNNMYNNLIFTSTIGENYMIICNKGQSFEYREVIKYGQAWSNLSQSPYSLDMHRKNAKINVL